MANVTIYHPSGATNTIMSSDLGYWQGQGWSTSKPVQQGQKSTTTGATTSPSPFATSVFSTPTQTPVVATISQPATTTVDPNIAARRQLEEENRLLATTGSAIPQTQQPTIQQDIVGQLTGEWKMMFDALKAQLDSLQKRGQVINPNIEVTPEKLAEFTKIAEKEIDPFYANQLKVAREGFLRNAGYSQEQLLRTEQDLERQYGKATRRIGESAAEQGFAQSGGRQLQEQELAGETQRSLEAGRRQLGFEAGTAARQFATQFGTSNLPSMTMGAAPTVGAGETSFGKVDRTLPFYELSPDVYQGLVGSQQFEQEAAKKRRISELEQGYRTQEQLNQQRQLL